MLPFDCQILPGEAPARQVVYAATRAIVSGRMRPGEPFPSVRELAHELHINPNTAAKVVSRLIEDGLIEVRPGRGTFVTAGRKGTAAEKRELLSRDMDPFLVEAKRLGLTPEDVARAVAARWEVLFGGEGRSRR